MTYETLIKEKARIEAKPVKARNDLVTLEKINKNLTKYEVNTATDNNKKSK